MIYKTFTLTSLLSFDKYFNSNIVRASVYIDKIRKDVAYVSDEIWARSRATKCYLDTENSSDCD